MLIIVYTVLITIDLHTHNLGLDSAVSIIQVLIALISSIEWYVCSTQALFSGQNDQNLNQI